MFIKGKIYRRSDLHQRLGGQQQGGISTPAKQNVILAFTGEVGKQYGYHDRWTPEGVFLYTGEGQQGDMQFARGNRAIRDHVKNGEDLYLFQYVKKGQVQFLGQMVCIGYRTREAPDGHGDQRKAFVFELAPVDQLDEAIVEVPQEVTESLWQQSLGALRARAVASSSTVATTHERLSLVRERSHAIRVYAQRRA